MPRAEEAARTAGFKADVPNWTRGEQVGGSRFGGTRFRDVALRVLDFLNDIFVMSYWAHQSFVDHRNVNSRATIFDGEW